MKKIIEGHPRYSVSSSGDVSNNETGRMLKQANHSHGYCTVQLGRGNTKYVHRLVAFAFLDGYSDGMEVNHKDGNKKNNLASNLEWVTSSENKKHAETAGLANHSSRQKEAVRKTGIMRRKLSIDEASEVCEAYATGLFTYREIGSFLNVDPTTISNIVKGKIYVAKS